MQYAESKKVVPDVVINNPMPSYPIDIKPTKPSVPTPNNPVEALPANPVATESKKSKFNWWWLLLLPIGYKILK